MKIHAKQAATRLQHQRHQLILLAQYCSIARVKFVGGNSNAAQNNKCASDPHRGAILYHKNIKVNNAFSFVSSLAGNNLSHRINYKNKHEKQTMSTQSDMRLKSNKLKKDMRANNDHIKRH